MCAAFMLAALAGAGTARAGRAIWIWERDSSAMLEDGAAADVAIAFLRARGIETLYLYADAFEGRNPLVSRARRYRAFLRRLHRHGMRAYALLGTARYILPRQRGAALAMFGRILAYNAAAAADERFDGVNLDIEPHMLDLWPARKMRLLEWFLDLGQALMAAKRRSGLTLQVGPAIPFWLDGIVLNWHGASRPVSEHVQDLYDYVALMDYRDHADGDDGMIALARDEIDYAGRRGKKVVLGVETALNEIEKVSFHHLDERAMERELALVARAMAGRRGFGGIAIHHYRGYRSWLERGPGAR